MSSLVLECPQDSIDARSLEVKLPEFRKCARCKSFKVALPINFYICNGRLSAWCRECHKSNSRQYANNHREERLKYMRRWHKNNADYDKRYYINYRDRGRTLEKKRYWKDPQKSRARARNWRKNQPKYSKEKDMDTRITRTFGISLDEYKVLLNAQGNSCAICGRTNVKRKNLSIDHDHRTGRVRGLLCINCNTAIGFAKDDIKLLQKIMGYIKSIKDSDIRYVKAMNGKPLLDILGIFGFSCKICGDDGRHYVSTGKKHARKRWLDVDHNHLTGMIRGILCHPCNSILGQFNENLEYISNAIKYLGRYRGDT